MPTNAADTPLDDDILDLTEVVEEGNAAPAQNTQEAAPAVAEADGPESADFGADLDALLDSLTDDASPSAPTAQPKAVAAPITDQTPAGHVVDPNEELAKPALDDIDSLLAELGAPTLTAPKPSAKAPDIPADDLPDDLAAMIAAAPKPVAKEAKPPAVPADDLPDDLAAMIAAAPAAPAAPETPPVVEATPETPPEPDLAAEHDNIDLNELDALLDDILAAAPAPITKTPPTTADVSSAVPATPAEKAVTTQAKPTQEAAPAQAASIPDVLAAVAPTAATAASVATVDPLAPTSAASFAQYDPKIIDSLSDKLSHLEQEFAALRSEHDAAMTAVGTPKPLNATTVEPILETLLAHGSPLMNTVIAEVTSAMLADPAEAGDATGPVPGDFHAHLEKLIASTAAKVIREELLPLMSGDTIEE